MNPTCSRARWRWVPSKRKGSALLRPGKPGKPGKLGRLAKEKEKAMRKWAPQEVVPDALMGTSLGVVGEGLDVVPAEDDGLHKDPLGDPLGGGHGHQQIGKLQGPGESNVPEDKSGDL